MPKGKRKGKPDKSRGDMVTGTSDEDSVNDNASVISVTSECRSVDEDSAEADEAARQEAFEDKLTEAIDGLVQKSAQARTNCLDSVRSAFIKKFVPDYVADRRLTICDSIERSLRKGRGAEQTSAAKLAPLVCVQLGASDASENSCRILGPALCATAHDASTIPTVRAECCTSLGVITFLSGSETGDVVAIMRDLEELFRSGYLRSDGSAPTVDVDAGGLHAAALSAWSLLLTLIAPADVYSLMGDIDSRNFSPSLVQLSELLLSPHLDVRISAGEALALAYELGREFDEDFADDFSIELIETLRQLATDSHKYRAKKDRKQQRATFRDVLHWIEEGEPIMEQVRLGGRETLILDSWVRRKQYDSLCGVLGPGLHTHLANNELLRDIFEMGARTLASDVALLANKQSKLERHLINAAAFKARTITRGKNRDKRSSYNNY